MAFFTHANINCSNSLERFGDWCFSPLRALQGGSKFAVVETQNETIAYPVPEEHKRPKWQQRALAIAGFIPGLICKGLSCLDPKTRASYLPWKEPEYRWSAKGTDAVWDKVNGDPTAMLSWYMGFVRDPKAHLQPDDVSAIHNKLPYLNLKECCCSNGFHDRFATNTRQTIEKAVISDLKAPKSEPLRVLSFGSGELLEDFILIGKLIEAGYKKIDLTLVDKRFSTKKGVLHPFDEFFEKLKEAGIEVNIRRRTRFNSAAKKPYDLATAIDLDSHEAWASLSAVRQSLKPGAHLYFTNRGASLSFDHSGKIKVFEKNSFTKALTEGILSRFPTHRFISAQSPFVYGIRQHGTAMAQDFFAVDELVKKGYRNIVVQIEKPVSIYDFKELDEEEWESIYQPGITDHFKALERNGARIEVQWVDKLPQEEGSYDFLNNGAKQPSKMECGLLKPSGHLFFMARGYGMCGISGGKTPYSIDASEHDPNDVAKNMASLKSELQKPDSAESEQSCLLMPV